MNRIQEELNKITENLFEKIEIKNDLQNISEFVFNNFQIIAGKCNYGISEIEFYVVTEKHPDPFSYMHEMQNEQGVRLFFHYSGIDIVFNNKEKNPKGYASFIIREIYDVNTLFITNGPLKLKDLILNNGYEKSSLSIKIDSSRTLSQRSRLIKCSRRKGLQKAIYKNQREKLYDKFNAEVEYDKYYKKEYNFQFTPHTS